MARDDQTQIPAAPSRSRRTGMLILLIATLPCLACGCGEDRTPPTPAAETTPNGSPAAEASVAGPRRGYEVPIPQIEYWEGSDRVLKYTYEMRFDASDADGRRALHRNGWARAYYSSGTLEREGAYQWVPALGRSERVGKWTYYDTDGSIARVEERGGSPIWNGPDQTTPPPGTVGEGSP